MNSPDVEKYRIGFKEMGKAFVVRVTAAEKSKASNPTCDIVFKKGQPVDRGLTRLINQFPGILPRFLSQLEQYQEKRDQESQIRLLSVNMTRIISELALKTEKRLDPKK